MSYQLFHHILVMLCNTVIFWQVKFVWLRSSISRPKQYFICKI